ncbi:hypothetical protein K439DRAFT_929906 [Ramaria rubella]|nr:hypothetical protein K439DRAFT_929906 [Ramaria rubella]
MFPLLSELRSTVMAAQDARVLPCVDYKFGLLARPTIYRHNACLPKSAELEHRVNVSSLADQNIFQVCGLKIGPR